MRSIVAECVEWSVSLSATLVSPAKMAEPIEMPFGFWARMGLRNRVLDGGLDPPWEGAILGKRGARCKV